MQRTTKSCQQNAAASRPDLGTVSMSAEVKTGITIHATKYIQRNSCRGAENTAYGIARHAGRAILAAAVLNFATRTSERRKPKNQYGARISANATKLLGICPLTRAGILK